MGQTKARGLPLCGITELGFSPCAAHCSVDLSDVMLPAQKRVAKTQQIRDSLIQKRVDFCRQKRVETTTLVFKTESVFLND
jgi:hypothetical protein